MAKSITWSTTSLPSFRSLKVYVVPGPGYGQVSALFCKAGAKKAKTCNEAQLVVFLGGTDVNPALYGESACPEVVSFDQNRDARESAIFRFCVENKIPMMGICRGAQFLHVMNEGTLWQHVDGHANGNHLIYDVEEGLLVRSSSTHHQMMKFNERMTLLACTDEPISTFVKNSKDQLNTDDDAVIEVEACFYETTRCLCIQGHPEYGPPEFTSWSFHKLHDLMTCNWVDNGKAKELKEAV